MSAVLPFVPKVPNIPTSPPRHSVSIVWVGGYYELLFSKGVFRLYSATHRKSVLIDREVYLEDVRFKRPPERYHDGGVASGKLRARKPGPTDVALSHRMIYAVNGGPGQRGFWAFDPSQAGAHGYRPKRAEGLVIRGADLRVFKPSAERH